MSFRTDDTIVAIATPRGRGGIGVVRLSGPDAVRVAQDISHHAQPFQPRHATFTRVVEPIADREWRAVDEVVITWFQAPHSYTGDDVVEISCHGSPVLLDRVVALATAGGARLAEPGEFTLRAYLNDRIDLIQAEAVADLVDAVTPRQARAAMDQLEGTLTTAITEIDAVLFDLAARLEASLDFPDEGFRFIEREETRLFVQAERDALAALVARGREGRLLREGRTVVFAGRPNTGKSSLFNALAGAARAIVTDVPGTTRDLLTEHVDMCGVPVTLVDTAGARTATDAIEAEGVRRAEQARSVAELVLVVLDGSAPLERDDWRLLRQTRQRPRRLIINKSDLPSQWDPAAEGIGPGAAEDFGAPDVRDDAPLRVSAKTGDGLEALREAVADRTMEHAIHRDAPSISNMRHIALIETATAALDRMLVALAAGATEEVLLVDLGAARQALEEVRGRRTSEELLHHIFSRFCIGK
jgi:tRNA modification GTPase